MSDDKPRAARPTFTGTGWDEEAEPPPRRSEPTFSSLDADAVPVTAAPEAPAPSGFPPLSDRYRCDALLGEGGMGQVWRVFDRELHRSVALKVVRAPLLRSARGLQRFREEARIAAQLQHPGIVPVHDLGLLPDGRLWFTMKEVRGRTLGTLLQEVHRAWRLGRPAAPGGYTFRRMLDAFLRVCETVGYAHARGVVHRDLKPENIMVGAHGEVLVLDWGLAKILGEEEAAALGAEDRLQGVEDRAKTRMGAITGTPAYMPPEQARGQQHRVGPASDVYALGATLYDLLTERPPYAYATVERVLDAVIAAEPIAPPSSAKDGPPIDDELDRICLQALEPRPEDRYPDASAMAEDLAAWLDGATKRDRALTIVAQARLEQRDAADLERRAELLRSAARAQLDALPPTAGERDKWAGWDLEDEARVLAGQADDRRLEANQLLRSALTHAPDLAEAHALLADEYHRQHVALEASGRREEARAVESLLRAHDRGTYATYLRGEGAVTLVTDVEAEVELFRYELVRRRLVPVPVRSLGTTPLREVPLAMGSYLLVLRAPGRVETRYPVLVGRGEHWDGARPGGTSPFVVPLPRPEELEPDDCYVPAGWFWSNADLPVLSDPLPRRRLWCDGFVMKRFPVTNEEYLAFLDRLVAAGREEDALRWVPRGLPVAGELGPMVYGRASDGRFLLQADGQGHSWRPRMPAVMVPWQGARAYAEHRTPGKGWRLPMDLEWEKAARGVDERPYPWGHAVDPSWARMVGTPGRPPGPTDVGEFPSDVSPYGVHDLGGNVFDWMADPRPGPPEVDGQVVSVREAPGAVRRIRGGTWNSSGYFCRADLRRFFAEFGSDQHGFRLVRSFSSGS